MIKVENLTYDYPSFRALHDVTFNIPEGTVTALVGPNGAGKTTLMRCIAGLTQPLSGSIYVNGNSVIENPRKTHREIGFLADFFGLYNELTVYQALEYFAQAHGVTDDILDNRITTTIAQLNLSDKTHSGISGLSRGMRQRVAIGQAMIHHPKLLILDEPASGLDPEARHELALLFKELNANGTTLLVSSHILAELDEYSNNLLIIRNGRIVENDFFEQRQSTSRKLILKLAQANEDLERFLTGQQGVSEIKINNEIATFDFDGDENSQSMIMAALFREGFQVVSFNEDKTNLQEKYINTLKNK